MATITLGNPALLNPNLITDALYPTTATATQWILSDPSTGFVQVFQGVGFSYGFNGLPVGGTVHSNETTVNGQLALRYAGLNVPLSGYVNASLSGNQNQVTLYLTGGSDEVFGSLFGDLINAGLGADTVIALDGDDTVHGQAGDDDVNGNVGRDQVYGGDGADFVRGGRDNDTIYGDAGDDPHVNGNIGDDLVYGGAGADTVYGGQGQDTLRGETGNDLLSGDLGFDVLYGGTGADRFVLRAGSSLDWVADFSAADGDRIQLSPGAGYTVTAISGQVVIDLGGGDQLGLAGVSAGSFSSAWIVFG